MDNGNSASLELVDMFCYRGNMLSVDGDADVTVDTRVKISLENLRLCLQFL